MDGLATIAAKTLTIASTLHVLMVQHALTVLEILHVVARPERLVYCVIWMMPAHRIHAMLTPFVRRVRLTALSRAPVRRAMKATIVRWILMSARRDRHANTMEFVSTHPDLLFVIAHKDSQDHDARQTSTNVNRIRAKMREAVWTIPEHFDVFACQVWKI